METIICNMALITEGKNFYLNGKGKKDFWENVKRPLGQYWGSKTTVSKPKFKGTVIQVGNFNLEPFPYDNKKTKKSF